MVVGQELCRLSVRLLRHIIHLRPQAGVADRQIVLGAMAGAVGAFASRLAASFVALDERTPEDRLERRQLAQESVAAFPHIAEKRTKGAWYGPWKLVSLDGSTLDVADTAENNKAFGRPGASRGSSAYHKIRFVGLLESGTHVLWAARMGKYAMGEIQLATAVVPALRKGMLCLADRFFPGYKLWQKAARTGADLLWRVQQNARLEVDKRLADGSYLSRIYSSTSHRRSQRRAIVVRVREYRLKDVPGAEKIYRLITTILDPKLAPAKELAALYHERWEIETTLDELKTHLRGAQIVLRSKT